MSWAACGTLISALLVTWPLAWSLMARPGRCKRWVYGGGSIGVGDEGADMVVPGEHETGTVGFLVLFVAVGVAYAGVLMPSNERDCSTCRFCAFRGEPCAAYGGIGCIVGPVVDADPARSRLLMPAPMSFMSTWLRLNVGFAAGRQNGRAI